MKFTETMDNEVNISETLCVLQDHKENSQMDKT